MHKRDRKSSMDGISEMAGAHLIRSQYLSRVPQQVSRVGLKQLPPPSSSSGFPKTEPRLRRAAKIFSNFARAVRAGETMQLPPGLEARGNAVFAIFPGFGVVCSCIRSYHCSTHCNMDACTLSLEIPNRHCLACRV